MTQENENPIVIYEDADKAVEVRLDTERDTVWLTQAQMAALADLKADLIARGEATDLFARDRGDGLASLLGNLDQTVFGEPAYPSVEAWAELSDAVERGVRPSLNIQTNCHQRYVSGVSLSDQ